MRVIIAAGALAIALSLTATSTAAAADPVFIGDQFRKHVQAPKRLMLWASDSISKLRWDGWGGPVARARGLISEHAYGQYHYSPTRVVASRIRRCNGRLHYLRLRYTFHGRWHTASRFGCRLAGG